MRGGCDSIAEAPPLGEIEALELPLRPLNVLHDAGITTLSDLVRRSEAELLALRNFGRKDVLLVGEKLHHSVCGSGWCPGEGGGTGGSP